MSEHIGRRARRVALTLLLPALGACDSLLEVESPGRIADDDLASGDAVPGLVVGMRYDLSQAVEGPLESFSLAAGELFHGGSYDWADIPRGVIPPEDVGTEWNSPQQARWVAEKGIERISELLEEGEFSRSPYVAEAYLSAGFANRIGGEVFCSTAIDGGEEQPNAVHFSRAQEHFTQAIAVGEASGRDDIVTAAYAGRATVRAWQGDWGGAVEDASRVPVDFVWWAAVDIELRNDVAYETHNRFEYTVWGTFMEDHPDDPRAPWKIVYNNDGSVANGANGTTPMYQQNKYESNEDDIALTKGTEMLLLRAEAALRNDQIAEAYTHMNAARAHYGMGTLPAASELAQAWSDLHYERSATLWLEGRRMWDLRRWFEETGPAHHDFMEGRDRCYPISERERDTNPNLG
jgi:hypothetical protein